jgi:hypothetical protein
VLPERGRLQGQGVDPVVQVLAEAAAREQRLEVPVGGGDDADVHLHLEGPSHARQLPVLQDAQDLRLHRRGHVPDLVEEERPPVGLLEAPLALDGSPRERTLLVAEELALHQIGGDGRAVHAHERPLGTGRQLVDGAGHELLARPVLAQDENRHVGGSGLLHEGAQGAHGSALPDEGDLVQPEPPELPVLALEARRPERVAQGQEQAIQAHRLLDEVEGAEPRRLHRVLERRLPAHQNDGHGGGALAQASEELEPVHPRHHHVGQDRVHGFGLEALQRPHGRGRGEGLEPLHGEGPGQRAERRRIVVDDENAWLHPGASFAQPAGRP